MKASASDGHEATTSNKVEDEYDLFKTPILDSLVQRAVRFLPFAIPKSYMEHMRCISYAKFRATSKKTPWSSGRPETLLPTRLPFGTGGLCLLVRRSPEALSVPTAYGLLGSCSSICRGNTLELAFGLICLTWHFLHSLFVSSKSTRW